MSKKPETENKKADDLITVRAHRMGFYNGARRRPGDVFRVPAGFKGKWFKPTTPTDLEKQQAAFDEQALVKAKADQEKFEKELEAQKDAQDKKVKEARQKVKDAEAKAKASGASAKKAIEKLADTDLA